MPLLYGKMGFSMKPQHTILEALKDSLAYLVNGEEYYTREETIRIVRYAIAKAEGQAVKT